MSKSAAGALEHGLACPQDRLPVGNREGPQNKGRSHLHSSRGEVVVAATGEVAPRVLGRVPARSSDTFAKPKVEAENVGNCHRGIVRPQSRQQANDDHGEELLKMVEKKNRGRYDVVEIFSPPRMCQRACERQMRGGWSLDWSVMDPVANKIWYLGMKENQMEVLRMIRRDRPRLLIACPPCTLFSKLQFIEGDPEIHRPENGRRL